MANFPTAFPDLNAVLSELDQTVQEILGDNFVGTYLQGSFAVGDGDSSSDVDFIVAVKQQLNAAEVAALNAMHAAFVQRDGYWNRHLEGSYYPLATLRRYANGQQPPYYVDNGATSLALDHHDDTQVVRWCLWEYGIALSGPSLRELVDAVSAETLTAEIRDVMHEWGNDLLAEPNDMRGAWMQQFVVLSYCRMLHSLATGRVTSKLAAARWAQATLDPRWQALIDHSLAERQDQFAKVFEPADPQAYTNTVEFIGYALAHPLSSKSR